MKFDLVAVRGRFFAFSAVLIVLSLLVLAIPPALRPGIEFTSGTTTLIRFELPVDQAELREMYASLDHPEARVQSTGGHEFLIRTSELEVPPGSFTEPAPEPDIAVTPVGPQPIDPLGTVELGGPDAAPDDEIFVRLPSQQNDPINICDFGSFSGKFPVGTEALVLSEHPECGTLENLVYEVAVEDAIGYVLAADTQNFQEAGSDEPIDIGPVVDQGERTVIETALRERFGAFEVLEFSTVSPVVSRVAVRNATIAVAVATLFIMAYVAFAFASVPRPFRYAVSAIIALVHDVVIVLGAFSLFGKLFGFEINLMFVTGLLTVIGFSVHDSIVVFDRIRENVRAAPDAPLEDSVNAALLQTLARSLNTSLTLLLTVAALLLLGGVTIREFLLVILVGVTAGTYSSIGIAAQVLVAWEQRSIRALKREPQTA